MKALAYVQRWNPPITTASGTFNGNPVGPTPPFAVDPAGSFQLQAYRFDVTSFVTGAGNYPFSFTTSGGLNYYAALVVIFDHPSQPDRTILINDGSEAIGTGSSTTLYAAPNAGPGILTVVTQADDAISGGSESIVFNGSTVVGPGEVFNANQGPFASLHQVPVTVVGGANSAAVTTTRDLFGWHLAILDAPGGPKRTTLTLSPKTATNPVDSQHTVMAEVKENGTPLVGVVVRFQVTGSVNTTGSCTTDTNGTCTFTYTGPAFPGADAIHAFADLDNDGIEDPLDEPSDNATKTWVLPPSTAFCEVTITDGGHIRAANGDRANFGGNATVDSQGNPQGQQEYRDHGPAQPMNVHSINVLAVTCPGSPPTEATIFGEATIDGAGSFLYRIDVEDHGESGKGVDKYQIRIPGKPYDSGDQFLQGGNVQIHK